MDEEYLLKMAGISKEFPGVKALDDVQLNVRKGSVHALIGENGAGKSTLMKILIGLFHKDSGSIIFDGKELEATSISYALQNGISMIFQELNPIKDMTVAENIYVGREPISRYTRIVDMKKMNKDTEILLNKLEIDSFKATDKLYSLSVAKRQMVEISKALSYNSKLIIMDEPTSAITETECEHLFRIVNGLKNEGVSFIFITHKIDEIFKVADEITIMRDGKYITTEKIEDITKEKAISLMVGREINQLFPKEEVEIGDVVLSVENLTSKGVFRDISFDLRKGEILGLAGLMGAGRTELVETIFGCRKYQSGSIKINGKEISIKSPVDAIKNKIALITEDRKLNGLFLPLNVKDNIILPSLNKFKRGILLRNKSICTACCDEVKKYRIKTPSIKQIINNLSGGNQQKVLISRWIMTLPDIIILDEPTRGIDVGSKAEIHRIMTSLVKEGKSIIMISSEMPEIIGMSDRIMVMHEGMLSGVLERKEVTQKRIMELAAGYIS